MGEDEYRDAVNFIFGNMDLSEHHVIGSGVKEKKDMYLSYRKRKTIVLDVLRHLGSIHKNFNAIHVAGTNGKGSTCAMINSIIRGDKRLKVGLFTSPHLHSVRERIIVDGDPISRADFVHQVKKLKPLIKEFGEPLHPFQKLTVLAFSHFNDVGIDYGVVEVGIGGLKDSTNVFSGPKLKASAVTAVGFDHMNVLGNTIEEIAHQKSGIAKKGVPIYTIPQLDGAEHVIERRAKKVAAPYVLVRGIPSRVKSGLNMLKNRHWSTFQDNNIAIAATITNDLIRRGELKVPGSLTPAEFISEGIVKTYWPGRFEELPRPRTGRIIPKLMIDCAHNVEAVGWLMREIQKEDPDRRKVSLIYGSSRNKDFESYLPELPKVASRIIITKSSHPRAGNPADIKAKMQQFLKRSGIKYNFDIYTRETAEEALKLAHELDNGAGGSIYSFGSVFLTADIRKAWNMIYPSAFPERDWVHQSAGEPLIGAH